MEVIQSVKFKYTPTGTLKKLLGDFNQMVNFCIDTAIKNKVTSLSKLHRLTYPKLKERFDYNTQYFISAQRVAQSILKAWKQKGKEPKARKPMIRFSPLLTKLGGNKLRISVRPKEFVYVDLVVGDYQRRFLGKPHGMIIMNEEHVIIPFKTEVEELDCGKVVALDFNERNITGVTSEGEIHTFDTSEAKRLHDCYFELRREIQTEFRGDAKRRALSKYRRRERRRVRDFLHKVTRKIADTFKGYKVIMEDLTHIRKSIRFGKRLNRRLSAWNFRLGQSLVDYKARLNGSPVQYVNPKGTSKRCSRCGDEIAPNQKACPSCGLDRHVNACLNMLKMWGLQATLIRPSMTEEGSRILRQPEIDVKIYANKRITYTWWLF